MSDKSARAEVRKRTRIRKSKATKIIDSETETDPVCAQRLETDLVCARVCSDLVCAKASPSGYRTGGRTGVVVVVLLLGVCWRLLFRN